MLRILLLPTIVLGTLSAAFAQTAPTLRANVSVSSELVRVGDFVDQPGDAAHIALFRAPDLGTAGAVPVAQVIEAMRAHNVIGVATGDIREVIVTREARTLSQKQIETDVARALAGRNGLGDAASLMLTFDRDVRAIQLDADHGGGLTPLAARYNPRNARFDVTFEVARDVGAPTRLRFTGTAIETVEAAVVTRTVERGEILSSADVVIERRPKAEAGFDHALRARAIGMQLRKSVRAGALLRMADLAKADLVQRDQNVTLIYETPGIYLTMRGKAIDGGAEGDTVSVTNLQSKRTVQGTVTGPGQVTMSAVTPRLTAQLSQGAPASTPRTAE
ncbi:flagellar basal body P-ring formation chaperone FlgA [Bradyrhizobium sp. LHD-71]|uniref:flagellar basal body P-ring formation chaperone FlgA n=1 Tax=Bradyrhizobium sp. LHD-71 TaxID=3072141 RepID=UPI00280DF093|nr:flagellar basal body P-ring formation chaperone FlgA [Bradyrhizobium sp. LHD-71]MDQ8732615.1 flagellar basal body P-ring formation chaperone FlgA [Bradyrhizobium sp. LHD-71]